MSKDRSINHANFVRRLQTKVDNGPATADEFDDHCLTEEDIDEALGFVDDGDREAVRVLRRRTAEEKEGLRRLLDCIPDGGRRT
jgi:hypothetical protein